MINVLRISVLENIVTENATLLDFREQSERGIPNFFEDGQICYRDQHGQTFLSDDDAVAIIVLRKARPTNDYIKVKRVCVTWDQLTFSPALVLPLNKFEKYQIPLVFNGIKQFCFLADDLLHLTKDDRVGRVEL